MPFPQMSEIIPEGSIGCARVEHRTPSKFDCMRAALHGQYLEERTLASLFVHGSMVMSDGPEEHKSNWQVVSRARGNVLIAGLGIGMILKPILAKADVQTVTVVEKYQDVIDLIGPHFRSNKLAVINADIFNWKPVKGTKYDCIYFDIWADICTDNLSEITKLHQRFKGHKAAGAWMGSWNHELLKYRKRQGR